MADQPLVCICIPTFNAADTVRDTVLSILKQTYRNLVIHVSDNASTDKTVEIIKSIGDSRLHIHLNEQNLSGEENFNRCIRLAEGKYTAIFHADDIYEPEIVEKQVAFLENHTEAGAVFTEARMINDKGKVIGEIHFPVGMGSFDRHYEFDKLFKAVLLHSNFLVCPSVMVRTKVYKQVIKFWREDLFRSSADLDVWFRISKECPIGLLPLPLMRYRIGENQYSANVRSSTNRADFFLVIEHYLKQEEVQAFLTVSDFENYKRLDRRDKVVRAVNCVLHAKPSDAEHLLHDLFSYEAWRAGIQTKRGFGVLLVGLYLRGLLLFRMEKIGQYPLRYLKRLMRK